MTDIECIAKQIDARRAAYQRDLRELGNGIIDTIERRRVEGRVEALREAAEIVRSGRWAS